MKVQPYGENGILISFAQEISESVFYRVQHLSDQINSENWKGVQTIVPSYNSILLRIDSGQTSCEEIKSKLSKYHITGVNKTKGRGFVLPVCYEDPYALDIILVAARYNTTIGQVIDWHVSQKFLLYCMGFLPGFIYLGKLKNLEGQRMEVPRQKVDAGSVGIAGYQTGIYPLDSPGGWEILGRSPIPIFYPGEMNPFPFLPGDRIQFRAIKVEEYESLHAQTWTVSNLLEYCQA